MINKGILKFPKRETMAINENPILPVALVNTTSFDIRALIESKKTLSKKGMGP